MTIISTVVLAALRVHPTQMLSRNELRALSGGSDRMIRAAISELRRAGWLIVGDESGYRFAQNVEEVNQVITSMERQARSLHEGMEVMREAATLRFEQPIRSYEYQ